MAEMILASLSKIWHLVPIVIAIILFRKYIKQKDKKTRMLKNEEHEKNGLNMQLRTKKKYEDLGYKVINEEDKNHGIDLHMKRDDKTFLFHCNDSSISKSVTHTEIGNFIDNALKYIKTNEIKNENIELRFVIQYEDILHKSAINLLGNNSHHCKYIIA